MTDGDAPEDHPWLQGTKDALSRTYDVGLLDLDGVVYVGARAVPAVPEILGKARDDGMRVAFVTNNASRSAADVARHLQELGIAADEDDVVTSAQAAVRVVVDRLGAGAAVLVTGSPALRAIVEAAGRWPVTSADEKPDAVVQGFWSELRHADLAEATVAVRGGAFWVATNTDSTLPSPRGLLPGNGALVDVVARVSGVTPVVAGKPELPLHAEGVRRTKARTPLVVGDRLDTDIEGANAARTPSLLVLTGVASPADLLDAPPKHRPTYIGPDLSALLEAQPQVDVETSRAQCGRWTAKRAASGHVEVAVAKERTEHGNRNDGNQNDANRNDGNRNDNASEAPGQRLDGLRALLALVWDCRDRGLDCRGASDVLSELDLGSS